MKQLILCRHAKSSWKHPELTDRERPLNKRGRRNVRTMGLQLAALGIRPDLIISSPARRARSTAKGLAKKLQIPAAQIVIRPGLYSHDLPNMLHCIHTLPDGASRIMLVGHNPVWTALVNTLTTLCLDNLPTCGLAGISFPVTNWKAIRPHQGGLDFFLRPERKGLARP